MSMIDIREKFLECAGCREKVHGHVWILDTCEYINDLALCPRCVAKANTALAALCWDDGMFFWECE